MDYNRHVSYTVYLQGIVSGRVKGYTPEEKEAAALIPDPPTLDEMEAKAWKTEEQLKAA